MREAAQKNKSLVFTSLLHHVSEELLLKAFHDLDKTAARGVDQVSWEKYEQCAKANIADLRGRLHRGAYRAKPCRRKYISKPDGRQRPISIPSLEDKIVQKAVAWVLECIYEEDFVGFSYGFRPGRSQHMALDALNVAITERKVDWILDADIEGFFDEIDHDWLIKFLKHRIGDQRIIRLIIKWLKVGISEDGKVTKATVGTPQGTVISPLLSNIYLHYVLDLWVLDRRKRNYGETVIVRFADDFVIGFQREYEARKCLEELHHRLAKFGLKLHKDKTRLLEFGRFASRQRKQRGEGRPETFDFLGFTHKCEKTRKNDRFTIHRQSSAKRMRGKLTEIAQKLRERRHDPLGKTGRWIKSVVRGWLNYHAVPSNSRSIKRFTDEIESLWLKQIRKRSQKGRRGWTWKRMRRLAELYIPKPLVSHPYPNTRFHANTQGRSRMR